MATTRRLPDLRPSDQRSAAYGMNERASPPSMRLGEREREILGVVWLLGTGNVRQVAKRLSSVLAYTTVMTTLDRLFKKGLLHREKKDRAFIYTATFSEEEVGRERAACIIRSFFSESGEELDILLSCFVDAVHQYDATLLDELESKIQSARVSNNLP